MKDKNLAAHMEIRHPGKITSFLNLLRDKPPYDNIFNPWWEVDPINDIDENSYRIRKEQLQQYLSQRLGRAKYLLLGEALGYQGGHFTGIPMTSERLLLGHMTEKGVFPTMVFEGIMAARTSKAQAKENGFSEPTATIVWKAITGLQLDPFSILIWNAFPWHPYKKENFLSNRTPDKREIEYGQKILEALRLLYDFKSIIAVGRKAERLLCDYEIPHVAVRHPANGGAGQFRTQFAEIVISED